MLELARGLANEEITRTLADGVKLWASSARRGPPRPRNCRGPAGAGQRHRRLALEIKLESVFAHTHIPRHPIKGLDTTTVADR